MYGMWRSVLAVGLITCFLQAHGADKYTDENRPYEFGFNIAGEQHRHEKKDENGLIMGEFGFITADGVYHVTVYATDEQGRFRILSMKNIRVKPYPSGPGTKKAKSLQLPAAPAAPSPQQTAVTPLAPQPAPTRAPFPSTPVPSNLRSCSSCKIPTTTTTTQQPVIALAPVAPRGQSEYKTGSQQPYYPQQPNDSTNYPQQPNPQSNYPQQTNPQSNYPQQTNPQSNYPQQKNPQSNYPQQTNPQSNYPQQPNQQTNDPEQPNLQSNYLQLPSQQAHYPQQTNQQSDYPQQQSNYLQQSGPQSNYPQQPPSQEVVPPNYSEQPNQQPQNNGQPANVDDFAQGLGRPSSYPQDTDTSQQQPQSPQAPGNRNPKQYQPNDVTKPTLAYAQMQIVDKNTDIYARKPGEKEGLPPGVSKDTVSTLLYTFNYTVGFHGHYEEGFTNGAKKGYYYVTGRNGIRTRVDYEADENGFRPKITQEVLDLVSDEVPKPETEKDEKYGLKGYEFKWLYFPETKSR